MNFKVLGDSDCPLIHVDLSDGGQVKIESGSMAYSSNVEMEGKMNTEKKGIGGLLGAIGRSITSGESFFVTHATGGRGEAFIGIAPAIPGKIACLKVSFGRQYRLNTGAFLACDESVVYNMKSQDIGKAFFGGTGGIFVMETDGEGDILVNAFGDLLEMEVTPERPLRIDNEHVVAWDSTLDYNIQAASGMIGFTTGEGLVNEFHGSGKVLIQTRNLHSLANAIRVFIPTQSSN